MNSIIESFYLGHNYDITDDYIDLRSLILDWLKGKLSDQQ